MAIEVSTWLSFLFNIYTNLLSRPTMNRLVNEQVAVITGVQYASNFTFRNVSTKWDKI